VGKSTPNNRQHIVDWSLSEVNIDWGKLYITHPKSCILIGRYLKRVRGSEPKNYKEFIKLIRHYYWELNAYDLRTFFKQNQSLFGIHYEVRLLQFPTFIASIYSTDKTKHIWWITSRSHAVKLSFMGCLDFLEDLLQKNSTNVNNLELCNYKEDSL
jgi:hypothetical protein